MPTALTDAKITIKKLCEHLRAHYGEKTSQLAARVEFKCVSQKDGQTVDEFAAALRTASLHCQFGAKLNGRLRNQLMITASRSGSASCNETTIRSLRR